MTEDEMREKYAARVRTTTLETLPAFIEEVMAEELDYGSSCVAAGLIAATACWAAEKQLGLTGFQAGAVTWEFIKHWGSPSIGRTGMASFVDYDNFLYPQYADRFGSMTVAAFKTLQKTAAELLAEKGELVHEEVRAHWQSIVDGTVPFNYELRAN